MAQINAGMTGAQFIAAINNDNHVFNIKSYGALGNNNTDNTAYIQAAINAAHAAGGGVVYVPAGIYKTGTLTMYYTVSILGDNGKVSVLKSIAAEPLINYLYETYDATTSISRIRLDGDSTGTIGLNMSKLNFFRFEDLRVLNFTQYGALLNGCLVGSFNTCYFSANVIGVYAQAYDSVAPNLLSFNNSTFNGNTSWGIYFKEGLMLKLDSCDLESCGTHGNTNTGCIYYKSAAGAANKLNVGLVIRDTWMEQNDGTLIFIDEPTATIKTQSLISGSLLIVNTSEVAVKIIGATTENKLIIENSNLHDGNGLIITGASASVINNQSYIAGSIIQNDSSKYYTVDATEVT